MTTYQRRIYDTGRPVISWDAITPQERASMLLNRADRLAYRTSQFVAILGCAALCAWWFGGLL